MRHLMMGAAAVAAVASLAGQASADETKAGPYIGAGYGAVNFSDDRVRVGVIGGRVGFHVNSNFAVEAEAAIGVQDDNVTVAGVDVKAKLDSAWAIFAVVGAPVNDDTTVFARLGYASTTVSASAFGVSTDTDDDGYAAGVGGTVDLTDHLALRADYTYVDGNVHALTFGGQVNF